ncbi:MAG: phage terminase large subunit, partial [Candidatus Brocadiia bacterium]
IGSGKSHVGCFWALLKALRNPRCLGLIGANSYRQLKDATLRTFEGLLRAHGIGYRFHRSADVAFRLDNGAEVLCRSMENYDLLRGIELGWFYLDELRDTRLEAWQVVKGRLRSPDVDRLEGRVTSSPNGYDWMWEEFVRKPADPRTAEAYAGHEALFARTCDNRHLPPDYLATLLASYDPLLAAQELDGQFLNVAQGRVYYAFDRAVHVTEAAELVPGQPLYWSLDFNVTPMTAVVAQADERGLRVVDELWRVDSNTPDMCRAFAAWLAAHGLAVPGPHAPACEGRDVALRVYGDATGSARTTVGASDYAIIREHFPCAALCVGAANPPRRDRYNAVNAALRNARGQARLRIHPRCRHLVEDLEREVYLPEGGEPDRTDPLRGHIADALGYLVARLMPAGRRALAVGRW